MTEEQKALNQVLEADNKQQESEEKQKPEEEDQKTEQENDMEEAKPEETNAEEPKPEEAKPEETNAEEPKPEEAKPEETNAEEPKPEEPKVEDPKPAEKPAEEQKPEQRRQPERGQRRGGAAENVVLVGKKPTMSYVLAVVTQFSDGMKDVHLKARGRSISRAVDVAEVVKNRFLQGAKTSVLIGTEEIIDDNNNKINVSTIDIGLNKV